MYCPICLNETLQLRSQGVIHISFNGKQMETSKFLFNLKKESMEDLNEKLEEKIDEFMDWYAQFKNKSAITKVEIFSNDFICRNNCKIDYAQSNMSIIGLIFDSSIVMNAINDSAEKRKIDVEIEN